MNEKIVLAGVPNCGKTTLWNLVTGNKAATGNYSGVTVKSLAAPLKNFSDTLLVDLPGTYSLFDTSLEEKTARNFLEKGDFSSLIVIFDGTKPEQGLYFTLELLSFGIPTVIGINFADELRAQKICVSTEELSAELGAPVFLISAKKGEGIKELILAAKSQTAASAKDFSLKSRRKKSESLAAKYFVKQKSEEKSFNFTNTAVMFLFFALVLGLFCCGNFIKSNLPILFERFTAAFWGAANLFELPHIFTEFITDGVFQGLLSVLTFIPELFSLFFALAFLESSGYMAYFAFGCDLLFKKIGLSGKSAIPLLLGFGCTVSGVYATCGCENEKAKKRTLSALMFIPCSARLPLTLLVCKNVFGNYGDLAVIFFFAAVLSIGATFSFLQNRKKSTVFVFELPKIRIPSIKAVLKISFRHLRGFLAKSGWVLVLTAVGLWLLKNFSLDLCFAELKSESAIFQLSKLLAPLFSPLGIGGEGALALFCGLFAKESALFAINSLGGAQNLFSPISACSFLLFFLIYSPCLGCLSAIAQEFGIKKAAWLSIRQTAIAYIISFAFYQSANFIINLFTP